MKRFKKILHCVSRPESPDENILRRTVDLARRNQASVTLLTVLEESSPLLGKLLSSFADLDRLVEAERREQLESLAASLRTDHVGIDVAAKLVRGRPYVAIIEEVLQEAHDLVMVSARNRTDSARFFGTTAVRLMRKCPAPVWVQAPGDGENVKRVLVTLDLLPASDERKALNEKLLDLASSLAKSEQAELFVLHVWDAFGEGLLRNRAAPEDVLRYVDDARKESRAALDEFLAPHREELDADHVFLEKGDPGDVIPQFVERHKIDVTVLGTVVRTGIPGLIIGNTAEKVLSQIRCSVLAVKPDGFVSPIALR